MQSIGSFLDKNVSDKREPPRKASPGENTNSIVGFDSIYNFGKLFCCVVDTCNNGLNCKSCKAVA